MRKEKFFLILALFFIWQGAFSQQVFELKLKLKSAEKINIDIAPLKYNKQLAFSFTLDDGYRSAFTCAYPLLSGGKVSVAIPDEYHSDSGGDGQVSKGLYYSDGCGNKIPFRLAVALNGGIVYDHPANRARLSWAEVKQLDDAGWDMLNHGYHHATKHGTDYKKEVDQNISVVKDQLNFTMSQFVVPGGEHDAGYEHIYEQEAFHSGSYAVASYVGTGPAINTDKAVNLDKMIYARDLFNSNKDSADLRTVDQRLLKMDSLMQLSHTVWYNAFTHSVGNKNLWTISMIYPEFKYFMTKLAERYGQEGTDKIWMAPWQQVYEYVWLKDHAKVEVHQSGKDVTISMSVPEWPKNFRNFELSLNVRSASSFRVVPSKLTVTDNGQSKHNLINITLNNKINDKGY